MILEGTQKGWEGILVCVCVCVCLRERVYSWVCEYTLGVSILMGVCVYTRVCVCEREYTRVCEYTHVSEYTCGCV